MVLPITLTPEARSAPIADITRLGADELIGEYVVTIGLKVKKPFELKLTVVNEDPL
jgi:hypothetical protein